VGVTEHCPGRIGATVEVLRPRFEAACVIEKSAFAATDESACLQFLHRADRRQIVGAGLEAHVCVLQTVRGLLRLGCQPFVITDAVGSRAACREDRAFALQRMQRAGAVLVSTESALFEWTQRADDPRFRDVLEIVKALSPSA
jgi:nicotinamidase-related amidase